jgi:hypothetical protein
VPEKHWYPPAETHYVEWDRHSKRLHRAICGRLISDSDESPRPTCGDCMRILRERLEDAP